MTPASINPPRPSRARSRSQSNSKTWLWALLGCSLVLFVLVMSQFGGAKDVPPGRYGKLPVLIRQGQLEEAEEILDGLESWAAGNADRRAWLDKPRDQIASLRGKIRALENQVREKVAAGDRGLLVPWLKTERDNARGEQAKQAAEMVLAGLADLLLEIKEEGVAANGGPVNPPRPGAPGAESGGRGGSGLSAPSVVPSGVDTVTAAADPEWVMVAANRLAEQGQFAQAMETLQSSLQGMATVDAAPLYRAVDALRLTIRAETKALLQQAETVVAEQGQQAALDLLIAEAHRFPDHGALAGVAKEIESLQSDLAAPTSLRQISGSAVTAQPSAASASRLSDVFKEVRAAEREGDHQKAAGVYRAAAKRLAERDPAFAQVLASRALEQDAIARMTAELAEAVTQNGGEVQLATGETGFLKALDEDRLGVLNSTGTKPLAWFDVPLEQLESLLRSNKAGFSGWLGGAVLALRKRDDAAATRCLLAAWQAEPSRRPELGGLIAAALGEAEDPQGYFVEKGGFVSATEVATEESADRLSNKLTAMLRRDSAERDAWLDGVLAAGGLDRAAVQIAMGRVAKQLASDLVKDPGFKMWQQLGEERAAVDAARKHALELIYNEEKYFYPYKAEIVGAEKAKLYAEVQKEVEDRVEAIRSTLAACRTRFRMSGKFRERIGGWRWLQDRMLRVGLRPPVDASEMAWIDTLPTDAQVVTVVEYCRSVAERDQWVEWQRIAEFNRRVAPQVLTKGEERQLEVTNEYRALFRHRPLAVNAKIVQAARSHALEMGQMGYFSHFSPVAEHRTPFDRMRIAGYKQGVSENIAINSSPEGAHGAWLRSSGHHRNLLNARSTEYACGIIGRHYVQNFGTGKEYRDHGEWPGE